VPFSADSRLPSSLAPNVSSQPSGVCSFVEGACRKVQDGLSSVFLVCIEVEAVKFEEQHTDNKTSSLVAVDERMVADNTGCVKGGHCDDVGNVGVGMVLAGTSKSGLEQFSIAQSRRATVDGYQALVDRRNVALLDPERSFLSHFASAWSVFR